MIRLGSQRWLRVVFLATALVFVCVAVYVYAFRFFAWVEPDAAVQAVLGEKVLQAKSPIVGNWYYANGDIWVLGPQLFALLPVAIVGLGPASLLITVVLGFVLELGVLVKVYLRLSGELWIAIFAAMVTLMAWSSAHVAYAYIQLAYGFVTCLYLLSFTMFAQLAESSPPRPMKLALAGLLVGLIAVQNPTRGFVYVLAPLLFGCVWPWRDFAIRRRLTLAAAATAGWVLAFVVYTWILSRVVAFSIPRGHIAFVVGDVARIKANLVTLALGLNHLCGSGVEPDLRAIPGALILVGAFALLTHEIFSSRAFATLRFLSVIVLAQLGAVLVPMLIGNLLVSTESVRYIMPSLLAMLGLAVVIAVRTVGEVGRDWLRRLAIGWLAAVPLVALVAAPEARPPSPQRNVWPDGAELANVADELIRRGLTHGFSSSLEANLLTLETGGTAMTCSIYFRDILVPQRWLADTSCFTASAMPDRFYVVADRADHERKAIRATLPREIELFSVGDTYEVYVFRTRETSLAWLDLPLTDGDLATFPMRIPATHLALLRGNVAVESGELVATGEQGTVLHGPYIELPKGRYDVSWIGKGIESGGQLAFKVTAGAGVERLTRPIIVNANDLPRDRAELVRLSFNIGHARSNVEFSIDSGNGGRVSLYELLIERKR